MDRFEDELRADSESVLEISSRCADGENNALVGRVVDDRVLSFFAHPRYRAQRGVVTIPDLQVAGACGDLVISVTCTGGPCTDTLLFPRLDVRAAVAPGLRPTDAPGQLTTSFVDVSGFSLGPQATTQEALVAVDALNVTQFKSTMKKLLNRDVAVCVVTHS